MGGRASRIKGRAWEQEVARRLRPVYGPDVRRGYQKRAGSDEADVEGTPWWIEAKKHKITNIKAALRQAIKDTDGRAPVAITRDDRKAPLVTMLLDDWIELLQRAHGAPKEGD